MKTIIIILAILIVAGTALAQRYGTDTRSDRDRTHTYGNTYEPPPLPRHQTEYPPDYFTIRPYGAQVPEGPNTGYRGQRYWNPRTGLWEASPYTNNW